LAKTIISRLKCRINQSFSW